MIKIIDKIFNMKISIFNSILFFLLVICILYSIANAKIIEFVDKDGESTFYNTRYIYKMKDINKHDCELIFPIRTSDFYVSSYIVEGYTCNNLLYEIRYNTIIRAK